MKKEKKEKNYRLRSKLYGGVGNTLFATTTFGSFVGYEIATDWSNFKTDLDNFMVVQPETMKLNIALALPVLIVLIIYVILWRKRNKKKLEEENNISFGLLITILILYAVYSILEVTLVTLVGAFIGSIIDEKMFKPLSRRAKIKADDDHDVNMEVRKEKKRNQVRRELDGSV